MVGRIVITEEFIGVNGVRVCVDNDLTEILNKVELETEWALIDEENFDKVKVI